MAVVCLLLVHEPFQMPLATMCPPWSEAFKLCVLSLLHGEVRLPSPIVRTQPNIFEHVTSEQAHDWFKACCHGAMAERGSRPLLIHGALDQPWTVGEPPACNAPLLRDMFHPPEMTQCHAVELVGVPLSR